MIPVWTGSTLLLAAVVVPVVQLQRTSRMVSMAHRAVAATAAMVELVDQPRIHLAMLVGMAHQPVRIAAAVAAAQGRPVALPVLARMAMAATVYQIHFQDQLRRMLAAAAAVPMIHLRAARAARAAVVRVVELEPVATARLIAAAAAAAAAMARGALLLAAPVAQESSLFAT